MNGTHRTFLDTCPGCHTTITATNLGRLYAKIAVHSETCHKHLKWRNRDQPSPKKRSL